MTTASPFLELEDDLSLQLVGPIPVNDPKLDGNERTYLLDCIDTGWISSEGPYIERFEAAMAEKVDRRYGVGVANGSAALEIAVAALKLSPGDEVILPSFTIISCVAAVLRNGATPVAVDCDPVTLNSTASHYAAAITPRTKVLMVVHIYGLPVDMDPILNLAEQHGLAVIEDAAEMHGQTYKGRPCGSFGTLSTFSFYPNKLVTAGEGGMVMTDDPALAENCRSLRNLCFNPNRRFVHDELGWNYRLTNMQAALGLAQVEKLDQTVARKRAIGATYTKLLASLPGVQLPLVRTDYAEGLYWVFSIILNDDLEMDAEAAMTILAAHKIGTRPFFWPMHLQPVFQKMNLFRGVSCPVAERIARQGFYLPSGLSITEVQIRRVAAVLKQVLR
ncbi:DegT/DnrJ/EryC1/StrS family aminotransferase [Thalassospira xiamenensis]|uniref:DegT/DnrJ/EryC1/StrS family aminotransferase n=1 Tax=Thalassospira xiamenensis TaxID=220697 RepID=UPI003AA84EC7